MNKAASELLLIFFLLLLGITGPQAFAQTLATQSECNAIGGQWDFNVPRPQFARCSLNQYYAIAGNRTLRLGVGVELEVGGNGVLHNQGRIEIPNTAQLDVNGGVFTNEATLYADNRAEIYFRRGQINNNGRMDIEGDVFIVNTARLPSGWRECWYNAGTFTLFSGGNLFNRGGCFDGNQNGVLDVQVTGTFVNEADGFYRGGSRDSIGGVFRNERSGWAQLRDLVLSGELDNHGDAYLTEGSRTARESSEVRIVETGIMRIGSNSQLSIGTRRLRVDGMVEVNSARLRDGNRPLQVNVGSSGDIQLFGLATAWSPSSQIELDNQGSIVTHCLSTWYPAQIQRGNPVYRRYCFPFPGNPFPGPFPLPNPIWP